MVDDLEHASLDGVRVRDMTADEARSRFDQMVALLEEAGDDWSRTYLARLARLLYLRLVELGAAPQERAGSDG